MLFASKQLTEALPVVECQVLLKTSVFAFIRQLFFTPKTQAAATVQQGLQIMTAFKAALQLGPSCQLCAILLFSPE